MVSIPSALVLLVLAMLSAMSPARAATPVSRAFTASSSPSERAVRKDDTAPDAGWRQAVRTDAVRAARFSSVRRDAGADRRERSASVDPAWIPLPRSAARTSRAAALARRERPTPIGVPGQPAPSSRAPPVL
jgi:hypothetical protein